MRRRLAASHHPLHPLPLPHAAPPSQEPDSEPESSCSDSGPPSTAFRPTAPSPTENSPTAPGPSGWYIYPQTSLISTWVKFDPRAHAFAQTPVFKFNTDLYIVSNTVGNPIHTFKHLAVNVTRIYHYYRHITTNVPLYVPKRRHPKCRITRGSTC